jgi:DNA-binding transcriptional ArsR family regulator
VSRLLGAVANPKRLMLCVKLLEGEKTVGELAEIVGLCSPALSQHLSKMRATSLLKTRMDGQTIHHRLDNENIRKVSATLDRLYGASGK